jgi:hypothetical protein
MKNVAGTAYSSRVSSTIGVHCGPGPSSNVNATTGSSVSA